MAEFVPVEHDPFATDITTTLNNAASDQPDFTASDSISHLATAWKRGSDVYADKVKNPLSITDLGRTWQDTPGFNTVSGFGPGNVGAAGVLRPLASEILESITEVHPFDDPWLNKLAAKIEVAHESLRDHIADSPLVEDDAAAESNHDLGSVWKASPAYREWQESMAAHGEKGRALAQSYHDALSEYAAALQEHLSSIDKILKQHSPDKK